MNLHFVDRVTRQPLRSIVQALELRSNAAAERSCLIIWLVALGCTTLPGVRAASVQPRPIQASGQQCSDSPPPGAEVMRLGGEADLDGDDTPTRVHFQLCEAGGAVWGQFTTEGDEFQFIGRRDSNRIDGELIKGATRGTAHLGMGAAGATGRFEAGSLKGDLRLKPTKRNASSFIHPAQTIDITPAEWQEDLDKLVEVVTTRHGSPFGYISKQAFFARVAGIRHRIPHNSGVKNALEFRKLLATIGDGHTQVDLLNNRPLFPLETYWFADGIRVVAAPHDHPELLGTKLQSINEAPIGRITDGLKRYVYQHEAPVAFKRVAAVLLPNADLLADLSITKPGLNKFLFLNGKHRITLFLNAGPARSDLSRFQYGYPLWQRNKGQDWWTMELPDGSVYVNWRSYNKLDENSQELLKQLDARHPRRLLIDLRDNGGGDYNVGRRFIDRLKARPWLDRKGVLYVLVGRRSFSAAMTNAVDFEKDTHATLVGETLGARPNGWQESRSFFLPNSGIGFSVSVRYYSFLPGQSVVGPALRVAPRLADWSHKLDAAVVRILGL